MLEWNRFREIDGFYFWIVVAGEEGKVINLLCEYDHDNFSRILHEHRSFTIDKIEIPQIKRVFAIKSDDSRRPFRRKQSFHRGGSRRRY